MKLKNLLLVALLLLVCNSYAQQNRAELIFKDGTVLNGLAEPINDNNIKFRKERKAKRQYFNFSEVDTLKVYYDFKPKVYVLVDIEGKKFPKVLELAHAGKNVAYYRVISQSYSPGMAFGAVGGAAMMATGTTYINITHSYARKTNQEKAIHLGSSSWISKNFKTAASNYFSDCPKLVEKIQNKELKKKHIQEIIMFYNTECDLNNL
jgi:hypothetical protein